MKKRKQAQDQSFESTWSSLLWITVSRTKTRNAITDRLAGSFRERMLENGSVNFNNNIRIGILKYGPED